VTTILTHRPRTEPHVGNTLRLCRAIGISHRSLDYWCRTGLIGSRLYEGRGQGNHRDFTHDEVLRLVAMKSLASLFNSGPQSTSGYPLGVKEAVAEISFVHAASSLAITSDDGCTSVAIDLPRLAKTARKVIAQTQS
jgi:hypothetical protein